MHFLHYNVLGCKDMQIINKTRMLWNNLFFISSYYFLLCEFTGEWDVWRPDVGGRLDRQRQRAVCSQCWWQASVEYQTDRVRYCFHRQRNRLFARYAREFDVYMQNQPSDENKLCIYLYQENQGTLVIGVRLGNTGNKELDWSVTGNGNLILPQTDFERVAIVVTCSRLSLKTISVEFTTSKTDDMEGYLPKVQPCTRSKSRLREATCAFTFYYTKTRSSLFSIDNVCA